MRSRSALLLLPPLAAALLTACANPPSDPSQETAQERRLKVIKGTATGIVLIPAPGATAAPATPAAPAASAARTAGAPAPAGSGGNAAAAAAPQANSPSTAPAFGQLGPPTGLPPSTIKKLDRPDLGIALPSAASASQPAK